MTPKSTHILTIAELASRKPTRFLLEPSAAEAARLADALGCESLRKIRLEGQIAPRNRRDWQLEAKLGATAVQPCAITLAPVTTRIDAPLRRLFLAEMDAPEAGEAEMSADPDADLLPESVDLMALLEEELRLALPAFPRAQGASLGELSAAPSGAAPLDDAAAKPFAGLAGLRAQMGEGPEPEGEK